MKQIAIKILECKGYNLFLAVDKNNIKYEISNNKLLEVGKYYKIDLIVEQRNFGMLGSKTRNIISNIEKLEVVNNRLCLKNGELFKSA